MRTGVADLPLHWGSCPRWLFERMKKLGRKISEIIVLEFGRDEFLKRISDPFFFQSFACVLGFDWHSSGVTTTVCGALKEAKLQDLGVAVLGGKGKSSRKTLQEIEDIGTRFSLTEKQIEELKYNSRMCAKVDNNCVQDGYSLYHHSFIVSEDGKCSVVQQGMNPETRYARRYHWLSEKIKSFVVEPHSAICCDSAGKTLNMVAKESEETRKCSVDLIKDNPVHLKKYLFLDRKHGIDLRTYSGLLKAYEFQPKNYEELVSIRGLGAKTIRALALISSLVYGAEPSWKDPVSFSFAHGGKDGHPYPVDRKTYDRSIEVLSVAVENAKLGNKEKLHALRRLKEFLPKEDVPKKFLHLVK